MLRNPLLTVVVADPDALYQRYITNTLKQEGFRCITTGTLREAYQAIQREHPALLILELDQPDGDGIGFIQYLQADPQLKQILIACLTHRRSIKDKVRAFRAGTDDYIVKPMSLNTFAGQMLMLRRAGHMARAYSQNTMQLRAI